MKMDGEISVVYDQNQVRDAVSGLDDLDANLTESTGGNFNRFRINGSNAGRTLPDQVLEEFEQLIATLGPDGDYGVVMGTLRGSGSP